MNDVHQFDPPNLPVRYFAIRESGEPGWRMMMFDGGAPELRHALADRDIVASDIHELFAVFTRDPPAGLNELGAPDRLIGLCHGWVFDAAIQRWRAPDEALTPLPGTPEPVETLSFKLEIPDAGWMPVKLEAGARSVTFSASTVYDPFPDLVDWLEALAGGGAPRLLIDIEGVNVIFHVFQPEGDTVRFVVANDSQAEDVVELDVRIDRRALVRAIYEPFLAFWESQALARAWRSEWRYDDDDATDPRSDAHTPYSVRSPSLDALLS